MNTNGDSRNRLIDHYDKKYLAAGEAVLKSKKAPSSRFEACLKFFPRFFRGGKILEIGAGSGEIARAFLNKNLEFEKYILTEISETRLNRLNKIFSDKRIQVIQVDAESIPLDSLPSCDAVIMVAVVEHLIDPISTMKRLRQILKPGGFLYIDTANVAKYSRRLKLLLGRFPSTASRDEGLITYRGEPVDLLDEGHFHYFTYRSLRRVLLERCGFSDVIKLAYFPGKGILARSLGTCLARIRPELFSELVMIARNGNPRDRG